MNHKLPLALLASIFFAFAATAGIENIFGSDLEVDGEIRGSISVQPGRVPEFVGRGVGLIDSATEGNSSVFGQNSVGISTSGISFSAAASGRLDEREDLRSVTSLRDASARSQVSIEKIEVSSAGIIEIDREVEVSGLLAGTRDPRGSVGASLNLRETSSRRTVFFDGASQDTRLVPDPSPQPSVSVSSSFSGTSYVYVEPGSYMLTATAAGRARNSRELPEGFFFDAGVEGTLRFNRLEERLDYFDILQILLRDGFQKSDIRALFNLIDLQDPDIPGSAALGIRGSLSDSFTYPNLIDFFRPGHLGQFSFDDLKIFFRTNSPAYGSIVTPDLDGEQFSLVFELDLVSSVTEAGTLTIINGDDTPIFIDLSQLQAGSPEPILINFESALADEILFLVEENPDFLSATEIAISNVNFLASVTSDFTQSPVGIPTPTAAGAGILMLAGLILRRRRARWLCSTGHSG